MIDRGREREKERVLNAPLHSKSNNSKRFRMLIFKRSNVNYCTI